MDKSTGEPLLIDGEKIVAETTFTDIKSNGTVNLEFTFNASTLAGTTVVVFERLYHNGVEIATHTDLEDEEQTVSIVKSSFKKCKMLLLRLNQ